MRRFRKLTLALSVLCGLAAGSTSDVVRVATSGKPSAAASRLVAARAQSYQQNHLRLVQDLQQTRRNYQKLVYFLSGKAGAQWGRKEVVTPSNKRYVKSLLSKTAEIRQMRP